MEYQINVSKNRGAKTFALNAIKGYFKDPTTCGYENGACVYLTTDGRSCVAGRFMLDPEKMKTEGDILDIIRLHGQESIFIPEVVDILSADQWNDLQVIHDTIATKKDNKEYESKIKGHINNLNLFTYEELVNS